MIFVPTDTAAVWWVQTTNLDGTDYLLEFRYNAREACYYMSVSLTDGTVLAQSIKLVSNYRLFQAYASSLMPPGELAALSQSPDDSPAALGDLGIGQRVQLTYFSQADNQAFNALNPAQQIDPWRL